MRATPAGRANGHVTALAETGNGGGCDGLAACVCREPCAGQRLRNDRILELSKKRKILKYRSKDRTIKKIKGNKHYAVCGTTINPDDNLNSGKKRSLPLPSAVKQDSVCRSSTLAWPCRPLLSFPSTHMLRRQSTVEGTKRVQDVHRKHICVMASPRLWRGIFGKLAMPLPSRSNLFLSGLAVSCMPISTIDSLLKFETCII